jgi:hypothetical protein
MERMPLGIRDSAFDHKPPAILRGVFTLSPQLRPTLVRATPKSAGSRRNANARYRGISIEIVLTGLIVPGIVFFAIPLGLAVLLLRSARWSLVLAALVAAVFLYGSLAYPATVQRLQHPEDVRPFLDAGLRTVGLAAALVGSAVASLRALRQGA